MKLVPVIIAGGSGSRLWPVSRKKYPKQFIPLTASDKSLLQLTLLRFASADLSIEASPPLIIANEEHRFMTQRDLQGLEQDAAKHSIVLEPEGRNTAPAIGLAAELIRRTHQDALMLVLPADAFIKEVQDFINYINIGIHHYLQQLNQDTAAIGTFGIKPSFPHTGYGYIKTKATKATEGSNDVLEVEKFVEKPETELAKSYVASGEYFWNCGIFLMTASDYLTHLEKLAPKIHEAVHNAMDKSTQEDNFIIPDRDSFLASPSDSIDYALMEKAQSIFIVPMDITWSDVGSWKSLAALYDKSAEGNSIKGNAVVHQSKDTFVYSTSDRLVTALGIENIAIVDTPDSLLVTHQNASEEVKSLIEGMDPKEHPQATENYRSHRPWGWYESLIIREGFQVKRLAVYPGAKLSLQSHKHRSEHWVVVRGTAIVTCDDKELRLTPNQSTYIPLGAKHRLANPGEDLLMVIEVQCGDYLGEDDIIRYEDIYSRT